MARTIINNPLSAQLTEPTARLRHVLNNPNAYGTPQGDLLGLPSVAIDGNYAIVGAENENFEGSGNIILGLNGIYSNSNIITQTPYIASTTIAYSYVTTDATTGTIEQTAYNAPTIGGATEIVAEEAPVLITPTSYDISPPWSTEYLGTSYASVFYGTRGYLTFGAGSTLFQPNTQDIPFLPKIFLLGAYNQCNGLWVETTGTAPNRIHRVIVKCLFNFSETTVFKEIRFFENTVNRIEVNFDVLPVGPNVLTGEGIAYIFDVNTGALVHTLDNPGAPGKFFGRCDISGNYAIASVSTGNKAYIFNVTSGELVHILNNPNPLSFGLDFENDKFGHSLAISGNYAIVGAYLEDEVIASDDAGKAYIFDVTTGALVHTLDNPNGYGTSAADYFGGSVAISGNYAIVGAYGENDAGGIQSGKAYIFNVTTGALVHTLDNPNAYGTSDNDYFGYSVAISDNYAIVGAEYEDFGSGNTGKAYIFDVTTGALLHTLDNPNNTAGDGFGFSVAISEKYALVGALYIADIPGEPLSGRAYIFDVTTGGLLYTLYNPNVYNPASGDGFAYSLDISEDNRIIVSAPGEIDPGYTESGKAYIYEISNDYTLDFDVIAPSFSTPTGTSDQFLKADGTVDSKNYLSIYDGEISVSGNIVLENAGTISQENGYNTFFGKSDNTTGTAIYGGNAYNTGGGFVTYGNQHPSKAGETWFYYDGFSERMTINATGVNIPSNLTVTGDLTVSGTTTTVNTTNLDVQDAVITLNKNQLTPLNDIGILMQRYATADATNYNIAIAWDEGTDRLIIGKTPEDGSDNDISFNTEWMTITVDGYVGIGTDNPAANSLTIQKSGIARLRLAEEGIRSWDMEATGGYWRLNNASNSIEAIRVSQGGTIGIAADALIAAGNGYAGNTTSASNATLKLWDATTGVTSLKNNWASGAIAFTVGASERLRIDGSGNVGIGSDIKTNTGSYKAIELGASLYLGGIAASEGAVLGSNYYVGAGAVTTYKTTAAASQYLQIGGEHIWYNAPSGTADTVATFTERMRIDSNGKVGIGMDTPTTALDISGDIRSVSKRGGEIYLAANTNWVRVYYREFASSAFNYGAQYIDVLMQGAVGGQNSGARLFIGNKQQTTEDYPSAQWIESFGSHTMNVAAYYNPTGGPGGFGTYEVWVQPPLNYMTVAVHGEAVSSTGSVSAGDIVLSNTGSATQPANSTLLTPTITVKAGSVGIGTASPSGLLTVGSGTATTGTFVKSSLVLQPGWTATDGLQSSTLLWKATDVSEQNPFGAAVLTGEGTKNFYVGLVSTLAYFNAPRWSVINQGQERFTILQSGKVGINDSDPVSTLTVGGTAGINWASLSESSGLVTIGTQGTSGGSLFVNTPSVTSFYASGLGIDGSYSSTVSTINIRALGVRDSGYKSQLTFSTTSSSTEIERMRIDFNGNVGIGTGASFPSNLEVADAAGSCYITATSSGTDHAGILAGTSGSLFVGSDGNYIAFCHQAYGSRGTDGNITERMRIDSSGNVGIGTGSSVDTKLHVEGTTATTRIKVESTTGISGGNYVNSGGSFNFEIDNSAGSGYGKGAYSRNIYSTGAYPLLFWTSGSEAMRIDSSGNLLVGTADTSITADAGLRYIDSASSPNLVVTGTATSGGYGFSQYSTAAANYRFYTDWAGQIFATATSITGISDASLKGNVRDLDKGLDTVLALKPRRFDWKNGDGDDIMGFIAQEVEEVMPELVHEYQYNEDETKKALKMGDMIPSMVKAIQELSAQVDSLKAEVAALKEK